MAVKNLGGRWTSEVTLEEREAALAEELATLNPDERATFDVLIKEVASNRVDLDGDGPGNGSLLEVLNDVEYERQVVDPERWIEDTYYFGEVGRSLYPQLKKDFIELFTGDYQEVVLTGSIGWGKTHFAVIALCRMIYEMSCMKSPQESYGLSKGSQIVFPNYSVTEGIARKVVFGSILEMMQKSPYFQEIGVRRTAKDLRIPNKSILIVALPSNQKAALGMNVFGAIVDESNFIQISNQQQTAALSRWEHLEADVLYNSLAKRIKSRFMRFGRVPGMLFLVSSKTSDDSFTERKLIESRANSHIFVRDYAMYDVKPSAFKGSKKFRVLVGKGRLRSRILNEGENVEELIASTEGARTVEVPEDFRPDFENNLEEALRDIAGVSTDSISPFIHRTEKVYGAVDKKLIHPFSCVQYDPLNPHDGFLWDALVTADPNGGWRPIMTPEAVRHIHIDPSMLVRGGDAVGFVMAHISGRKNVQRRNRDGAVFTESAPVFFVDFMLRIIPPRSEEVSLGDVRRLVYELSSRGFPIRTVTMDRFQSADSIAKFHKKGYKSDVVSVDSSSDPYDFLKEALYEDRMIMYEYEPVQTELLRLEWDQRRHKVDHPKDGSKDVADALAGVIYTLTQKFRELPLEMQKGLYAPTEREVDDWVKYEAPSKKPTHGPKVILPEYKRPEGFESGEFSAHGEDEDDDGGGGFAFETPE